jgi:hypothetical protein
MDEHHSWELVCKADCETTYRMRVKGGMLYRYDTWTYGQDGGTRTVSVAMTLVPFSEFVRDVFESPT